MDGFKEFQGKDLDSAIKDACSYFDARREQLEIEILQDAKSGIFGIVGLRGRHGGLGLVLAIALVALGVGFVAFGIGVVTWRVGRFVAHMHGERLWVRRFRPTPLRLVLLTRLL